MASDDSRSSLGHSRSPSLGGNDSFHHQNGGRFEEDDFNTRHDGGINNGENDEDLFGDDDDDDDIQSRHRKLDDSELDSGDDEGRRDRLANTVEDQYDYDDAPQEDLAVLPADIGRIQAPEAENDELYLLNLPPFLGLEVKNFDPATFKPRDAPQTGRKPGPGKFSPFADASTSIFWRHDPQDPKKIQSNSRIIRWSDGSLTLQIASTPKDQYRVSTTALRQSFGKKNAHGSNDYDPSKDAQIYLGAPHPGSAILQIIAPMSAAMKILPTGEQIDESVLRLQSSLAAASAAHDPFQAIKRLKEDPESAKRSAEQAEKEIMRMKRRSQAAEEKQYLRRDRVLGRNGLSRGAGLSVAGLEDEDGMPMTARPKKARRTTNRRGYIPSDDEDEDYPRGRTKEDEYDLDDGFMAASDEEPEIYDDEDAQGEDDPDVDDLEIEGRQTVLEAKTRGAAERGRDVTPPRRSAAGAFGDESSATAGVAGSPHAGRKKRRVIADDDDEDE